MKKAAITVTVLLALAAAVAVKVRRGSMVSAEPVPGQAAHGPDA